MANSASTGGGAPPRSTPQIQVTTRTKAARSRKNTIVFTPHPLFHGRTVRDAAAAGRFK
jgi:hypothetical protein